MKKKFSLLAFILAFAVVLGAAMIACTPGGSSDSFKVNVASYNTARGSISFDKQSYSSGDEVTVTVTPKAGYELQQLVIDEVDVTADVIAGGGVYKFVITKDCQAEIYFKRVDTWTVTVSSYNELAGSVTLSPNKTEYNKDENVTVTVVANTGYALDSVMVDGVDVTNQLDGDAYSFVITKNTTVAAEFIPTVTYTVLVNGLVGNDDVERGTATLSNQKSEYTTGEKTTFSLVAKEGFVIESVTVNGVDKSDLFDNYSGSCELTFTENLTVEVVFAAEDLSVVEIVTADEFNKILSRKGILIVYFYADWCGACTDTAPEVEEFASMGTGAKVVKIDYGDVPSSSANITPEQNLFYIYSTQFASGSIIPLIMFFEDGQPIAGVESSILPISCETILDLVTNPDNYKK